jgi:hypothetical protein
VEWGDITPVELEWGGCERLGGRYYLIGGGVTMGYKGYGMFAFVADDLWGPFSPQAGAYRLCGNSHQHVSWLAAWCRGQDELLISNYASMTPNDRKPWMLPLRKPVVGDDNCLRMGWWPGNEALKARPAELAKDACLVRAESGVTETADVGLLLDTSRGSVLEGTIRATGEGGAAGFLVEEGDGRHTAVLLGVGAPGSRETQIGSLTVSPGGEATFEPHDVTGGNCATVTGIEDGREHAFRLLVRGGLFELYIDDLLMQTYVCKPSSGRIGFVARGAEAAFGGLRAWTMDL